MYEIKRQVTDGPAFLFHLCSRLVGISRPIAIPVTISIAMIRLIFILVSVAVAVIGITIIAVIAMIMRHHNPKMFVCNSFSKLRPACWSRAIIELKIFEVIGLLCIEDS